jgi:hypothetical protein
MRISAAACLAVMMLAGTATQASSATQARAAESAAWTVTPGGAAVANSGVIEVTDTTTNRAGVCSSSQVHGTVKAGSGLSGTGIGSVTATLFRACAGPARVPFTVTGSGLPWQISFTSYDRATGVVRGTVSHIRVIVTGKFCSAVVNGTSSTTGDGVVSATYTDSTGVLKFRATGGNLHFWDVKGCAPLLNNGDPAAFTAVYTVTPRQLIVPDCGFRLARP